MAPFSGAPSHAQQVTLALCPKFAAVLSILGSCYILFDIYYRRPKSRKRDPFHRLMTGLSISDILMSIGLFTSTWPMPSDTPNVYGARGNTASCTFIGFVEQVGVTAVLYNGSLSVNYLLRTRYGWTESQVERNAEKILHGVPIIFGITTMIAGLPLKLYNSGLFDCWIAPFPQGCTESWRSPDGSTTCSRGDNASLYQWVFDVVPKFSAILLVTINMLLIFHAVWTTEQRSISRSFRRHGSNNDNSAQGSERSTRSRVPSIGGKLSQQLALQSALYVGALYLTYLPVAVTRGFELANGFVHYEMLLTISITIPLQGFWNALVYLRPRWVKARAERRQRLEREARARRQAGEAENGGADSPPVPGPPDDSQDKSNFLTSLEDTVSGRERLDSGREQIEFSSGSPMDELSTVFQSEDPRLSYQQE